MRTFVLAAIVLLAAPVHAQFPTAESVINQAYYSAPYYSAYYAPGCYRPYAGPYYGSSWYYASNPAFAAYKAHSDYQTDQQQLRFQLNRIESQQQMLQWRLNR
jgi:hypothetical protein